MLEPDNVRLYADPIMIDEFDEPLGVVVYNALVLIRARLFSAGFREYKQAIVAKRETIRYLENYKMPDCKLITNNRANGHLYILTKSADGVLFIHPPYKEDGSIMPWKEYFERIAEGEKPNLMIPAPWAQARIKYR